LLGGMWIFGKRATFNEKKEGMAHVNYDAMG
jgi:hypothetical protein